MIGNADKTTYTDEDDDEISGDIHKSVHEEGERSNEAGNQGEENGKSSGEGGRKSDKEDDEDEDSFSSDEDLPEKPMDDKDKAWRERIMKIRTKYRQADYEAGILPNGEFGTESAPDLTTSRGLL